MARDIEKQSDQIVEALLSSGQPRLLQRTLQKLAARLAQKSAHVRYAGELTASQKDQIEESIRSRFDDVHGVEYIQDATLLGGIRIEFGDYVYDDSVRGRLDQLKGKNYGY